MDGTGNGTFMLQQLYQPFYQHFKWEKEQKQTNWTTVNCNAVSAILLKKEFENQKR